MLFERLLMLTQLKHIATISSGFTFRSRILPTDSGAVKVIQMKDLGDDNVVHFEKAIRADIPKPNQPIKCGDVIFRSRGQNFSAALVNKEAGDVVVAAPLFHIRPDKDKIVPEFLLWSINRPSSQAHLKKLSEGTMLQMVSKRALENLEIDLPAMDEQHKIANFFKLSQEEQRLLTKVKKLRARYAHGVLMRIASESRLTTTQETPGTNLHRFQNSPVKIKGLKS